ncbi:MAG: hypothetical protein LBJ32_02540 [Oscillospiraceae bacterium]|nr:hypothetical protein [Oscillospiraceae bacterium]
MPKFNSKKSKNNFSKILSASLAILNLFTSNFSLVKATENDAAKILWELNVLKHRPRKMSGQEYKSKLKKIKEKTISVTKITAYSIIYYFGIKIQKKYIKNARYKSRLAHLKDCQEEAQNWRDDFLKRVNILKNKENFKAASVKGRNDLINSFLMLTYFVMRYREDLLDGLNFNFKSGKFEIINTKITLDFTRENPLQKMPDIIEITNDISKYDDIPETITEEILDNLSLPFSYFATGVNIIQVFFDLNRLSTSIPLELLPKVYGHEFRGGRFLPWANGKKISIKRPEDLKNVFELIFSKEIDELLKNLFKKLQEAKNEFSGVLFLSLLNKYEYIEEFLNTRYVVLEPWQIEK